MTGVAGKDVLDGSYVRSDEFDRLYAYDGSDLGVTYTPESSVFKLWAPTASSVKINLYSSDRSADAPLSRSLNMKRGQKGVWSIQIASDVRDTAYDYSLTFPDGTSHHSPDPYAHAAVINGHRSVVLAPEETAISDFRRLPPFSSLATDARIAEISIRDTTMSPSSGVTPALRGKYLGLIQKGTHTPSGKPTGLDYMANLGITHVQIMPFYDFESVDESAPASDSNYNWGYDPLNYNVPEGSFCTDPSDPALRIRECKQMIRGLHDAGLRVVMDVVFNHVYSLKSSPLELTVPGYYFRYKDGKLTSHSFCGNDVASERAMARKYIVDSVNYWTREFKLDGFRFDIMGLIDNVTMNKVRACMDQIDPTMLCYGEGWDMHADLPDDKMTIQTQAYRVDNQEGRGERTGSTIGFFNDSLRDALKGSSWNGDIAGRGFVSGKPGLEKIIAYNILGAQPTQDKDITSSFDHGMSKRYADASQVQQYAEIHDGMTLFDKIALSLGYGVGKDGTPLTGKESVRHLSGDRLTRVDRMARLADAAVILAQGVPEIQLGQEFLRSKDGNGNSYKSGDRMNALDWSSLDDPVRADSAAFVRGLFCLRSHIPAFRYSSFKSINNHSTVLKISDHVVAWTVSDAEASFVVILNASEKTEKITGLHDGVYSVLVKDSHVNDAVLGGKDGSVETWIPNLASPIVVHGSCDVPALSVTVLAGSQFAAATQVMAE
jgi:pullulanase